MKNNESRKLFSQVCSKYDLKRLGSRNVFKKGHTTIAVSISTGDHIECRQFYEDCDMLLSYHEPSLTWYLVHKDGLNIDTSPNRLTSKGVASYTAKCELQFQFIVLV